MNKELAIECIKTQRQFVDDLTREAFDIAIDLLKQPQRKKGKWIDRGWSGDGRGNSWHEWECSECKHITKGAKWDFCPNCGARMKE